VTGVRGRWGLRGQREGWGGTMKSRESRGRWGVHNLLLRILSKGVVGKEVTGERSLRARYLSI